MRTRSLAMLCVAVLLIVAGCAGSPSQPDSSTPTDGSPSQTEATTPTDEPSGSDRIQAENVTLEQGQRAHLSIRATQVGELWFSTTPSQEGDPVGLNLQNVTFSHEPDTQVDTFPPFWVWKNVTATVTVEVPVQAAQDAQPGRYTYEISVLNNTDHDHESAVSENVTVEIARS